MKNNIKKMPGKAEYVIGFIIGNVFFFAYRIALAAGEKWPYVLLLVLSIILYLIWQDSFWMKLAMVLNVSYSIFMLFQHRVNLEYLYERQEQKLVSILLCVFVFFGSIMSAVSGIFVFIFGAIIGVAWRLLLYMIVRIPYFLYAFFASKFRDPIPEVHGITRRDKSVYFHKDCSKQQIQLIYRQGRRKKVLDTYPWKDFGFIPYSLEWKGENCIIVCEYNVRTAKQITEKEYTI